MIDSQSVKTLEGGEARGVDVPEQVSGRKRHLVVDTLGLLLLDLVHSAGLPNGNGDKLARRALFERIKRSVYNRGCRLKLIWADGGYRGELVDWVKRTLGWTLEIVAKLGDQVGFQVLRKRWIVERTTAWLQNYRRVLVRHERLLTTYRAFVVLACMMIALGALSK